jgi:hypothetical protein
MEAGRLDRRGNHCLDLSPVLDSLRTLEVSRTFIVASVEPAIPPHGDPFKFGSGSAGAPGRGLPSLRSCSATRRAQPPGAAPVFDSDVQ